MGEGLFRKFKVLVGIEDVEDEAEIEDDEEEAAVAEQAIERKTVDVRPAGYSAPLQYRQEFREGSNHKDKVISMNKTLNAITSQLNIVINEPKGFDECSKLVDSLKARKPVIINLEKIETELARKIFDFLSGATYALNGNMQKIANNIFVFVPENIGVTSNTEHKGIDFGSGSKSPWR
ncbi:MAG: cell division protein SepF [Clostridiales Family XIII bacterium]|jgi:cell division inhibitor SepF|nr:cell division protein SepF [Clostridiales Family XIII bacterium]